MSTGLIIDIVLLVIAAVTIIRYTFKGAVKAVFSFAKTFVALFLAYVLRKPAAMLINTLFMERSVTGWVYDSLYAASQGIKPDGVDLVKLYNDMPSFFTKILSGFGLDADGIGAAFDSIPGATEAEITTISENIGTSIATMLSTIIGFVAVFLLALLVLTIVVHVLDKLTHLPIINFANKLLEKHPNRHALSLLWQKKLHLHIFLLQLKADIFLTFVSQIKHPTGLLLFYRLKNLFLLATILLVVFLCATKQYSLETYRHSRALNFHQK